MFEHILIPLDGSSLAECVLPHGVAVARALGARATVLQVVEQVEAAGRMRAIDPLEWHYSEAQAGSYLQAVAERLRLAGLPTGQVLLQGDPAERVIDHAQAEKCGSHPAQLAWSERPERLEREQRGAEDPGPCLPVVLPRPGLPSRNGGDLRAALPPYPRPAGRIAARRMRSAAGRSTGRTSRFTGSSWRTSFAGRNCRAGRRRPGMIRNWPIGSPSAIGSRPAATWRKSAPACRCRPRCACWSKITWRARCSSWLWTRMPTWRCSALTATRGNALAVREPGELVHPLRQHATADRPGLASTCD